MKQRPGIGILLALTTAICWGALPIAMKQVLEVMEPPTIVFYRFLMASIGLGAILAVKKRLPPLRVFRKPRWLILLAVATAGLFGNFILFSSSLQYLSPTASQVIGQLSPVGMMVASVFILKEKMRSTQVVGALMLLSGLVMFFNTSLVEIFTKLTDYTWGVIFGVGAATVWVSYGVAQKVLLRRLASPQILFLLYTLCTIALFPLADPGVIAQLSHWQLACLIFCGLNTLVGYGALAEAMARWPGSAGERDHHAHPTVYAVFFRSFITGLARFLRQTDVKPFRLSRCVCRGCGRDVFRHWSSYLGRIT